MNPKSDSGIRGFRPEKTSLFWTLFGLSVLVLSVSICIEIFVVAPWAEELAQADMVSIWPKFAKAVLTILEGISEFTIIALIFGVFFNRAEMQNLIDEAASKFGFLGAVSRLGVLGFAEDAQRIDHSQELQESEKVVICLRGSSRFFLLRMTPIVERLKSGKAIEIICHSDRLPNISEILKNIKGFGCDVSLISVSTHELELPYNFIDFDGGVWIKNYFINKENIPFGAPAFFVEKDSPLWKRYQTDIGNIGKTKVTIAV